MKALSESMKEVEAKKRHLQDQVDQLSEDCAKLKVQGKRDLFFGQDHDRIIKNVRLVIQQPIYFSVHTSLGTRLPYHYRQGDRSWAERKLARALE